jgi:hypothetical protein
MDILLSVVFNLNYIYAKIEFHPGTDHLTRSLPQMNSCNAVSGHASVSNLLGG